MKRALIMAFFLFAAQSFGMDAPLGSKRPRAEEQGTLIPESKQSRVEKSSILQLVPEPEQENLKKYMATAPGFGMEKLYNVGRNIRNLRLVSKADRDWIDDPQNMNELIESLARRYTNNNVTQVVLALHTKPALEWLRKKLENEKKIALTDQFRYLQKDLSRELISQLLQGHQDAALALFDVAKAPDGAYLNYKIKDANGNTILNAAAHAGNIKIFDHVLPKSINSINSVNNQNVTPLLSAIEHGHTDIALKLLRAGAHPLMFAGEEIVDSVLLHAAEQNNTEVVRELLKNEQVRRHVNFTTETHSLEPIVYAAHNQNYDMFKMLLAVPDVKIDGEVIYWAIAQNQNMLADLLAQEDIDFNQESPTERGRDAFGSFGLFARSQNGLPLLDDNTARDRLTLIAPRIKLNVQDELGKTLLIMAVEQAKAKTVEKLLELGADTTLVDIEGKTALDYARELKTDNKERIIKLLQAAANAQMKK